jgi:hypothetical protein
MSGNGRRLQLPGRMELSVVYHGTTLSVQTGDRLETHVYGGGNRVEALAGQIVQGLLASGRFEIDAEGGQQYLVDRAVDIAWDIIQASTRKLQPAQEPQEPTDGSGTQGQ